MNSVKLKNTINTGLSSIEMTEDKKNKILHRMKEVQVVKKKMSFGLAVALIIMLMAAVSIAATIIWENYAVKVKETEHEQGSYANWKIEDKIDLIKILVENNHIESSDTTDDLFSSGITEADAHNLADQLMIRLTQVESVDDINLDVITYSIMGFFETWTPEQRVWWQQITNIYRHPDMVEGDTLVIPLSADLQENDAVEIARKAIVQAFELPDNFFENNTGVVADLYVTEQRPDYRRWSITFNVYREGDDSYIEKMYSAIVNNTGEVIADPDIDMPHVNEMAAISDVLRQQEQERLEYPVFVAINDFHMNHGYDFYTMSLDEKAFFSSKIRPLMLEAIEDDPQKYDENKDFLPLDYTTYVYGLPGQEHLTQEEAMHLSKEIVLNKSNIKADTLEKYVIYVYFDITNSANPIWRFYFNGYSSEMYEVRDSLPEDEWDRGYRVEIDALTGTEVSFMIDEKGNEADKPLTRFL